MRRCAPEASRSTQTSRGDRARQLLFDTDRHRGNATVAPIFCFRDLDGNRFLIVEMA